MSVIEWMIVVLVVLVVLMSESAKRRAPASEETRQKISRVRKAWWARRKNDED